MKIKRERQVRLDELLRLVWDGELNEGVYDINGPGRVHIDLDELILLNRNYVDKNDLFTITEEVEIRNDTVFDELVITQTKHFDNHDNKIVCRVVNKSIAELKKINRTTLHEVWTMKANGIGELIWSKERGLVD